MIGMNPTAWKRNAAPTESIATSSGVTSPGLARSGTSSISEKSITPSSIESSQNITFDLRGANVQRSIAFEACLETKNFMIRRESSSIETPIVFARNNITDVFSKIGRKYKDIKKIQDICLEYNVGMSDGSRRSIYVYNDEDAEENLRVFYSQTEEMSPYPLIVHVDKLRGRKERLNEKLYKEVMGKKFSCDIKFYEMLVDNLDIAIKFKHTRDFISVVMGRKCLNLLSPGHFYCHIRGCNKILVLGGFSKLHIVERHWHEHQAASPEPLLSCEDLALRYSFLKTSGGKLWYNMSGTLEEKIKAINNMEHNGKVMKNLEGNFSYIHSETKFEGRPLLVDEIVLDSIINGDLDALSKLPKQVTMKSYFSCNRKKNVNSLPSLPACTGTSSSKPSEPDVSFTITRVVEPTKSASVTSKTKSDSSCTVDNGMKVNKDWRKSKAASSDQTNSKSSSTVVDHAVKVNKDKRSSKAAPCDQTNSGSSVDHEVNKDKRKSKAEPTEQTKFKKSLKRLKDVPSDSDQE